MSLLSFLGTIWELIQAAWAWIKKIFLRVISFFRNIVQFFKERGRLQKIQQNKKILATSIKQNLEDGNVNVINCLFDTERGDLVDEEIDAQIMRAEDMDAETRKNFGNKDMIVLK